MKKIYTLFIALLLTGCGSTSPFTYHVKPTPLKGNETNYVLGKVNVNLSLGHGAIPGDKSFATSSQLKKQFTSFLQKHLKDKGVLASSKSGAGAVVNVTVDYTRTFNHGGKSLNKPRVSHSIEIIRDESKLASLRQNNYTTKYGYLKDAAVNLEIATFNRDAEDEPEDIELIAELIAEDIANAGS
jgi:hypothetical protein